MSGTARKPKRSRSCHERALGLLAVRARSRRELQTRLLRAGFDADEVEDVLARLEAVGLIDDDAFATAVVDHAVTVRRAGRRAVAQALYAKGVDREAVGRALGRVPDGEDERALELARDRATRLTGLEPGKASSRLIGFLQRRGYPPSVARSAAARALGAEPDPE